MDPGARAAEVNITLNRLVRDGLILGYKTDVVSGAAPGERAFAGANHSPEASFRHLASQLST